MDDENEGIIATVAKTIENNWRLILVGIIILAIALNSSWSGSESTEENTNEATPTSQVEQGDQSAAAEKLAENTENSVNNAITPAPTPESIPSPTPMPTPNTETTTSNTISSENANIQIAAKSEGMTHLSRRAIKEYLASSNENLSAEQKIYAEDYLSKKTGARSLEVGEKIEFSTDLIKQSVEQAKGLNQKQIENLSKYVPLAKNLN